MYSVLLSSYTNTRESLGELEKAVETLACGSCSHSISRSPKLPLVFVLNVVIPSFPTFPIRVNAFAHARPRWKVAYFA